MLTIQKVSAYGELKLESNWKTGVRITNVSPAEPERSLMGKVIWFIMLKHDWPTIRSHKLVRCLSGRGTQLSLAISPASDASRMTRTESLPTFDDLLLFKPWRISVRATTWILNLLKAANWCRRNHDGRAWNEGWWPSSPSRWTELLLDQRPSWKSCLDGHWYSYAWMSCQLTCCIGERRLNKFYNTAVRPGHQWNWRDRRRVWSGPELQE